MTYPVLGLVYFTLKTALVYFLIILLRASLPRFRIDQMMDLNWKLLTPMSLFALIGTALVYRLALPQPAIIRVVVLLALNGLILWIFNLFMVRAGKNNRRQPLAAQPRPVARAEKNVSGMDAE
ncbi:MAG: NADH-quinone oxidoreductase subunit H [Anaerolineaceae bacterium]|nr:NADH-quinone oxidoreductase subunit H [Anaerolineaceae bacterium]